MLAVPAFRNTTRAVRGAGDETTATVGSAEVNVYAVPGTRTPLGSSALAVNWIVSPASAASDVVDRFSWLTRYAMVTFAVAIEVFTRAVIVAVPIPRAVTRPLL